MQANQLFRPCLTLVLPFAIVATQARQAHADWYDDARGIIQQLIEDDIATQAVPSAAARIPALCEFFPTTVATLQDKRYKGLPTVLRGEAADAIGFVVLSRFAASAASAPAPAAAPPASATPAAASGAAAAPAAPAFAAAVPTALSQRFAALASKGDALAELARLDASVTSAVTVSSALAPAAAPPPVPPAEGDSSNAACVFPSLRSKTDGKAATVITSIATTELRKCLPAQADLNTEVACATALLIRDAAAGREDEIKRDAERVAAALLAMGLEVANPHLTDAQQMSLAQALGRLAANPQDGAAFARIACTEIGQAGATCETPVAAAAQTLLSNRVALDLATLDRALGVVVGLSSACSATSSSCKEVNVVADGSQRLVGHLRDKNYGAAVGDVFQAVTSLVDCKGDDSRPGCKPENQTAYVFLRALAVYSVDSVTSGADSGSAEADFRAAAVDLIQTFSGQGVRRNMVVDAHFLYTPELSLRGAWRPGHIGDSAEKTMVYPSIELARGRLRFPVNRMLYFSGNISALDPLGPLTEVATRHAALDSDPDRTKVFFLGLVVPRAELEFGIPDLTKNLVVGVGVTARFFRAEMKSGATTPSYCVVGGDCDSKSFDWSNTEASIFAKFVP